MLSLQAQPLRQRLLLLLLYTHLDAHMRERRACNTLQSQLLSIRSAGLGLATRLLKRCLPFDRNHHMLTLQQQQSMLTPTTNMSTAQGVTAPPHSKQHTHSMYDQQLTPTVVAAAALGAVRPQGALMAQQHKGRQQIGRLQATALQSSSKLPHTNVSVRSRSALKVRGRNEERAPANTSA